MLLRTFDLPSIASVSANPGLDGDQVIAILIKLNNTTGFSSVSSSSSFNDDCNSSAVKLVLSNFC